MLFSKNGKTKNADIGGTVFVPFGSNAAVRPEKRVVLVPFRTLVALPFELPFGNRERVRNALGLKYRALVGDGGIALFPQFFENGSNGSKGTAWLVSREELAEIEKTESGVFWPEPYGFATSLNGNGVVVCKSDGFSTAMIFENGMALLYKRSEGSGCAETLRDELLQYGRSVLNKEMTAKIIDMSAISQAETQQLCAASAAGSPFLDLSSSAAGSAEQSDKLIEKISSAAKTAAILGVLLLIFAAAGAVANVSRSSRFGNAPRTVYRHIFSENAASPRSSVARKLRAASGSSNSLKNLTDKVAAAVEGTENIRIDEVNYTAKNSKISGSADGTKDIEAFRAALKDLGINSQLGDVRQIPGAGLSFSVTTGAGSR